MRLSLLVFSCLTTLNWPLATTDAAITKPGRYVGKIENKGRISFVIARDGRRIRRIRGVFTTQELSRSTLNSGNLSEYFTVAFNSKKRHFPVYRTGFQVFWGNRQAWYTVDAGSPSTRSYRGRIQFSEEKPLCFYNPASGLYDYCEDSRGLYRPIRFKARLVSRTR